MLRKGAIDSMGKERARENREEFYRRAIEERIEVILGENREPARKFLPGSRPDYGRAGSGNQAEI